MTERERPIGVAVIGFGWMGRVHTQAYSRVPHHFGELSRPARLVTVVDEFGLRATEAAAQFGFERSATDWRSVLDDPEIEAVSITAPNYAHRELGIAFADAGKHIWIEKPVGVTADDAEAVAAAVHRAGVQSTVGFNYRNAPALEEAARLLAAGTIGDVTHAAIWMLGDYAADDAGAFTWRYELDRAGHGVIGDLAAHAVDLVRVLLGEIREVVADGEIFVRDRRLPAGATTGHARSEDGDFALVENEDWIAGLLRLESGVRVTLEASRVAVGHQNDYGLRIHGRRGALEWDFRRMGELLVAIGDRGQDQQLTTRYVGPESGRFGAFQPGAAIPMSYDDLKVIEAEAFLSAVAERIPKGPTIDDAVATARVLDALAASLEGHDWVAPAGVAR